MSYSNSFNIGADNLVLGSATGPVNIISLGGEDILINGVLPGGGGGGGGVPAIGDIDFIGNLNCNDVVGGGAKGIITAEKKINSGTGGIESTGDIKTQAGGDLKSGRNIFFNGQDIYKTYEGIVPQPANKTYKEYMGLVGTGDNNTFTGDNIFRETIKVQLSDGALPVPTLDDKIILNKDGTINADSVIKSSGLICENGAPETNFVKARVFDFRPKGANAAPDNELTGWNFSQKAPEAGAPAEDNYLMLQNTQATGSLNLVKSSFDPHNPTPFDIILDPQNGQVKTATSFDAPQVNFRKNAVDNWSIYQPPAGDANENKLRIQNYQDNAGAVQILDDSNNIWADFNNLATSFNKPTFINNTLNVIGNAVINSAYSLLFGAYSFKPIQYLYSTTITIRDTPDTNNYTNMVFNCLGAANQPTLGGKNVWTRVNDGQTGVTLYNNALEGFYKCSIKQLGDSSGSTPNFKGTEIIFDYILAASIQDTPDLTPPISYGYNSFPADRSNPPGPNQTTVASILIDHNNTLSSQSQPVFLNFSDPPAVGETMSILVTLTKLDF